MRLLRVDSLKFFDFHDDATPPYAIASHRWQEEEVTFQEVRDEYNQTKKGYRKVRDFAKYVRDHVHGVQWLWIDTCCINKDSAAELSEAINLMFKWYRNAQVCLAWLPDVDVVGDEHDFKKSEWFERGWTLQELLAPRTVVFFTRTWQVIGNKGASSSGYSASPVGPALEGEIAARTRIPEEILHDYTASKRVSVDAKFEWIDGRKTTRAEDMSYALYGVLNVTPGANYGEGHEGARRRLLAAIHHEESVAAQRAQRVRELSAWLSPPDPWTNHDSARKQHEAQTGDWLLNCDAYRLWKSGSLRHLWLYGKAGCGKTVLCSTVVADVRRHCDNAANAEYAVFYFTFSDDRKQSYDSALLSWVAQLCSREPALSMLQQAYERSNRVTPGRDELENILLASVESYDEVFLLIDALDECPEDGEVRQNVMECLNRLSLTAPKLKIFATSRELFDIRDYMTELEAEHLSVSRHPVDRDIRKYIATQLSRDPRLARLDEATKTLVENTISQKADGMFRWAYCQLQEMKKLKSTRPSIVEKALFALPATLDETYERMLTAIEERTDALKLLRWIAYARKPLSLGQLVDATIIDSDGDGSVEWNDRPGWEDALAILAGLITTIGEGGNPEDTANYEPRLGDDAADLSVDENEYGHDELEPDTREQIGEHTKFRLAHFSVKEYLESARILQSGARDFHLRGVPENRILSEQCLVYLLHYSDSNEKLSTKEDLAKFPLLRYAASFWYNHAAFKNCAETARAVKLLSDKKALYSWLLVHDPNYEYGLFKPHQELASGLYYASCIGHLSAVTELLRLGVDVNAQGRRHSNALQAAADYSYVEIAQILLEKGADVNARGGTLGNALQAASHSGNVDIVRILLEKGADVNAQGGIYGSALQAASTEGHVDIVQILLEKGADVNAQGGEFGNALQAASHSGNVDIVRILLEKGADINAKGDHGTALKSAIHSGHVDIVRILLEKGADINAEGYSSSALQTASSIGKTEIVRILLEKGADVNAQGPRGSALQRACACKSDNVEIVRILLKKGADVNAIGPQGSALIVASGAGWVDIIQILIEKGADVNAVGPKGSAFIVASGAGWVDIIQILIEKGADVNAVGPEGSALLLASQRGQVAVVQMLIEKGADVGGYWGQKALWAAYLSYQDEIVRILLEKGADALHAASDAGKVKHARTFLKTCAEIASTPLAFSGKSSLKKRVSCPELPKKRSSRRISRNSSRASTSRSSNWNTERLSLC